MPQGRLGRAALLAVRSGGIQAVFKDIQIHGRKVRDAIVVQGVVDLVEVKIHIGLLHALVNAPGHVQGKTVQWQQPVQRQQVMSGNIAQVAHDKTAGIADAAIRVHKAAKNFVRKTDVFAVLHRGHPETHDFGSELFNEFLRRDHVAHRLGHLAPVAVHHIPVGEQGPVRRAAARAFADQQRAVEPAAVLVRAFKIQVGGKAQLGTLFKHSGKACAGVKPDIKDVGFALPVIAAAMRAGKALRHDILEFGFVPVVATRGMLGKAGGDFLHPCGIIPGFTTVFTQQGQDGHAPLTLTRDAPVRAEFNHVMDALTAPGGNPAHFFINGLEGTGAQVVLFHADKPLGGRAEDDRLLAAPAMRVGVANFALLQQGAHFFKLFDDPGVGFKNIQPGEKFHGRQEAPGVIHWRVNFQPVLEAHIVVFTTVARRRVHAARTGIQSHMQAQHQR